MRRGVVGGGVLLASASGLAAVAPVAAADTPPDSDLAYLRLLIAAELLAADFQTRALTGGKLRRDGAHALFRRIRADEKAHYTKLAGLLTAAGQTPATSDDIDFSYPKGSFKSQASIVRLAGRLEHLMVGRVCRCDRECRDAGIAAADRADRRERGAAPGCGRRARRRVGGREGVRAWAADGCRVGRAGRVRELTMAKQQYTASEAAAALGISLDTLRRWDRAGPHPRDA